MFFFNKSENSQVNLVNNELNNSAIDKRNFLFVNYVSGIKGIPYDTTSLLVNDVEGASLNFVYKVESERIIKIPVVAITGISYVDRVRISNEAKKVEDNSTKSMLLSTVMFGGSPIAMMVGNKGINSLLDSISNNYEKLDFNTYYEIIVNVMLNGESKKLVFTSDIPPKEFVDIISARINNK